MIFSFAVKTGTLHRQNNFVSFTELSFPYRRVTCHFTVNTEIDITVKHNNFLIISSINVTCFGLEDHHQALKYFISKNK